MGWIWRSLSYNPGIKFSDILSHLSYIDDYGITRQLPWDWYEISGNPDVTLDDFLKNLTLFDGTSPISNPQIIPNGDLDGDSNWFWDQYYISSNENVTFDNILDYPPSEKRDIAISWDWDGVSRNPNLTYKDILNNPDKPWNWRDISSNSFDRYNAAVMIQRFYRKHGAFPRWKRVIEDSNMAILYNPKIGGLEFLKEQALVEREFNGE